MEINKENITTISIYREHDKLCILETYLNGDTKLESLVSNLIDYSMQKQRSLFVDVFNELKNIINNDIPDIDILVELIRNSGAEEKASRDFL
jgi:hypothetical protein